MTTHRSDTTPWPGEHDTLPAWGFDSEAALNGWRSTVRGRGGVMAVNAWRVAVRWAIGWLLDRPGLYEQLRAERGEGMDDNQTTNHEISSREEQP